MISLTLATAFAVRVMGAAFFTSGMVVVAIRISLALKLFDYTKYDCLCSETVHELTHWMPTTGLRSRSFPVLHAVLGTARLFSPELANGAIIVALRPSPGLVARSRTLHPLRRNAVWVDSAEVAYDAD